MSFFGGCSSARQHMCQLALQHGLITQIQLYQSLQVGGAFQVDVLALETKLIVFDVPELDRHYNPGGRAVKVDSDFEGLLQGSSPLFRSPHQNPFQGDVEHLALPNLILKV